jgi:hypothetical protein
LGLSLASSGNKVLVIEADLRRPTTSKYFLKKVNVRGDGLSELLVRKNITDAQIAKTFNTNQIPGISLVSSGSIPPNAGELLVSENMSKFLRYCQKKFDFVLNVSTIEEIDYSHIEIFENLLRMVKIKGYLIVTFDLPGMQLDMFESLFNKKIQTTNNPVTGTSSAYRMDKFDFLKVGYFVVQRI